MSSLTLRNVRPWGGPPADIEISGTRIAAVRPHAATATGGPSRDGAAALALPGFVNAHAHPDKSWWGKPWVPYGGEPTTPGRIAHERAHRDALGIPSVDSATAVLREYLRHGTTAARGHVDVDLGVGLRGVEVLAEASAAVDGAVEVEIVAFPQDGVMRRDGVLKLLDEAAAAGAASIGGIDPASIDRDPVSQLDGLFDIAVRRDVGLDIHLHDRGELGGFQFELIIERTRRHGLSGRVTISHGFALGELDPVRRSDLVAELAEAGIGWATVAPPRSAPLPWRDMRDRSVPLGLGTDGIRDLWSPFGDGDILRVALDFARLHGLRTDADLTYAVELASTRAAGFVHRDVHDLVPGARADIVLVDAENVPDALVRCPRRSLVIAAGRVVVVDGELVVLAGPWGHGRSEGPWSRGVEATWTAGNNASGCAVPRPPGAGGWAKGRRHRRHSDRSRDCHATARSGRIAGRGVAEGATRRSCRGERPTDEAAMAVVTAPPANTRYSVTRDQPVAAVLSRVAAARRAVLRRTRQVRQ